jgi:putative hydroxymethylpyrimidine transport system permease protein
MKQILSVVAIAAAILLAWELLVRITGAPPFILPGPLRVLLAGLGAADILAKHALITLLEIVLGLMLGTALGVAAALAVAMARSARRLLMPLLIASQAVPVFAIAPLLVLWLGYGLGSKVAMATLIIFFPVTAAFLDGLRRTDPAWLDLARTMAGHTRLRLWREFRHIRIPAALPALASGLRVATATAPIGAVVGEWVGSSAGLGYLMLHANGRMQIDLMFAALFTLAVIALALYLLVDRSLRRLLPWSPDSLPQNDEENRA